jgi:lipoprotein NlpD
MRCSDLNISWRFGISLLLLISLFLFSCTAYHIKTEQPRGVYHRVKSGETLWSIATAYDVDVQDLAEANNIDDPKLLRADGVIFIPDADQIIDDIISSAKVPVKESSRTEQKSPSKKRAPADAKTAVAAKSEKGNLPDAREKEEISTAEGKASIKQDVGQKAEQGRRKAEGEYEKIKYDKERFIWPVKGNVRSKFGIQPNGMYYNGIRISAKEGAPVLAAAGGTVIFSAPHPLKDYGETIIIKHADNYATVYTNLGSRTATVDEQIKRGSRIALMGKHETRGEAYINFEIRYKNKARNPLFFLP